VAGAKLLVAMLRRVLRFVFDSVLLMFTVAIGVPVAVTATVLGVFLFLPLPAVIPQPKPIVFPAPTVVYDRDGNQIAEFREFDQNVPVSRTDIPIMLKEAVISVEDRNFYQHGGVDIRGSMRAFIADLRSGGAVQGGSTITSSTSRRRTRETSGRWCARFGRRSWPASSTGRRRRTSRVSTPRQR
jgi:membrane peptidoglycan carboxypeptidase